VKETAIYIHIPFCDHKCIYCDFYSIINYDNTSSYLTALKKEIDYYSELYSKGREIISIFFGGGTPSFMNPDYISDIINYVKKKFNVVYNAEVTLETNPGTVSKEKLNDFKYAGINRISIGIQSFNNDELKFLTRIHNSETAVQTVYDAVDSGYDNISIDLIFNLPGQTKELWQDNLNMAVGLPIKHISAYSLILERGTILNKLVLDGKVKLQDDDYDADLYELTIQQLTRSGFYQYEVSNFAKEGYECIHNNAYWRYKEYLGFGTSSHSFINGKRWWNYSALNFYLVAVNKNSFAQAGSELLTYSQKLNEYIMLALRSKGICIKELIDIFGESWLILNEINLQELLQKKMIIKTSDYISLTPSGYAICDEIIKNFIY